MGDLSRREMPAVIWLRKVKMMFVLKERGLTERLVDMKRTTMLSCVRTICNLIIRLYMQVGTGL